MRLLFKNAHINQCNLAKIFKCERVYFSKWPQITLSLLHQRRRRSVSQLLYLDCDMVDKNERERERP